MPYKSSRGGAGKIRTLKTELKKLDLIDALERSLEMFVEDDTKRMYVFFVMLEFVNKTKIDTKKVTTATKKISYDSFVQLQKVVPMDTACYGDFYETFTAQMNSGARSNKVKVPSIEKIVNPWKDAIAIRLADDKVFEEALQKRMEEVNEYLSNKQQGNALKAALADPPVKCRNLDIKTRNAELVLRVLKVASKSLKNIDKNVKKLDSEQLATLMRYVSRGLSVPGNASYLLKWHSAATTFGGLGVITRVLCGPVV
jgi:hypothetical protein